VTVEQFILITYRNNHLTRGEEVAKLAMISLLSGSAAEIRSRRSIFNLRKFSPAHWQVCHIRQQPAELLRVEVLKYEKRLGTQSGKSRGTNLANLAACMKLCRQ
jgi:hypothetical protein